MYSPHCRLFPREKRYHGRNVVSHSFFVIQRSLPLEHAMLLLRSPFTIISSVLKCKQNFDWDIFPIKGACLNNTFLIIFPPYLNLLSTPLSSISNNHYYYFKSNYLSHFLKRSFTITYINLLWQIPTYFLKYLMLRKGSVIIFRLCFKYIMN